jgi:hypothetical protein
MCFLRRLERFPGVLQSLSRLLMRRQMIAFTVRRRRRGVSVRSHFVEFSGSLVRIVTHDFSLP